MIRAKLMEINRKRGKNNRRLKKRGEIFKKENGLKTVRTRIF